MAEGPLYIRIAVVVVNIIIILFHLVAAAVVGIAAPVSSAARDRFNTHKMCINISSRVVRNWFAKRGDEWRFHHRDYALLSMILPGRFSEFGRWSLLDDTVGYDSLGYMNRNSNVFVRTREGKIVYRPLPAEHWPLGATEAQTIHSRPDGMLYLISLVPDVDGTAVHIHPSDVYFEKHIGSIAKSLFHLSSRKYLDVIGSINGEIIDAINESGVDTGILRPELLRMNPRPK